MTAPGITPADIFAEVATISEMEHAIAVCAGRQVRTLSFVELMSEEYKTKQRLVKEFGPRGPADLQRFFNSHPSLALRIEGVNLSTNADMAVAAVRAFRASLQQ